MFKYSMLLLVLAIQVPQLSVAADIRDCEKQGRLGISVQELTYDLAIAFGYPNMDGALIANVWPNTPATNAGIERGDIIFEFAGKAIKTWEQFVELVDKTSPGSTVTIGIFRKQERITKQVIVANKCNK